jgi:hypothetical protein
MSATSLDLSQIKTDALSAASSFRTLIGLGTGDTPTFLGATLTGGTVTASAPLIDATQTWNSAGTAFTGMRLNVTDTASSSSSLLMDLQVGGSSRFSVSKSGTVVTTFNTSVTTIGQRWIGTDGTTYWNAGGTFESGNANIQLDARGGVVGSGQGRLNLGGGYLYLEGGPTTTGIRTFGSFIIAPAALGSTGAIEQRNTTNAQTFRIYNTFTDSSNYERGKLEWSSNVLRIGTEKAGTGSARALELQTDGTTRLTIDTGGNTTINTDVSTGSTPLTLKYNSTTKFSFGYQGIFSCGSSSNEGVINLNAGYGHITTVGSGATTRHLQLRSFNGIDLDIGGLGGSGIKLLTFGGTTSSFPAIKRNAAALNFRLADDSADCDITAAALTLSGNLTISTKNIVTDTTTGTKIGTATTQKLGFFNATPVVQPTAVADATDAASVITQLNALLSRMRTLGLIAT